MDEITLAKNGFLIRNDGTRESDPLCALGARVVLAEGYTLRSFVQMLSLHPLLTRLSPFAQDLAEGLARWPASGCAPAGIARLELSKTVEIIGHPAPPRLEIYHALRGVGTDGEDLEIKPYPVETLLDLPVILGRLRHVVFGDRMDEFRFQTVCNLFEFQEGIGWQLAFHGAPVECALRR
jgi:hypothetical protein